MVRELVEGLCFCCVSSPRLGTERHMNVYVVCVFACVCVCVRVCVRGVFWLVVCIDRAAWKTASNHQGKARQGKASLFI